MASVIKTGQTIKGHVSTYLLTKELYRSADNGVVFLARQAINFSISRQRVSLLTLHDRNHNDENCIVKSIPKHWRLENEASILKRYQDKTPFLRPLLDEIQDPLEPSSIVLKYLDTDLLRESNKNRLSRPEIKQVAKNVLEALRVFHRDGLVHTGTIVASISSTKAIAKNLFCYRCQVGQHFRQSWSQRPALLQHSAW
jgi:serine/threonine protein kinase